METSEYIKMIEFMYKYLLCVLKQQNIVSPITVLRGEGLVIILLQHHRFQCHTLILRLLISFVF